MSPRREHESVSAIRSTHPYSAAISDRGLYTYARERDGEKKTRNNAIYNAAFLVAFTVSHVDSHRGTIPFTVVTRDRGRSNVTAFSTCSLRLSASCPLRVLACEAPLEIYIEEPRRRVGSPYLLRVIIAAIITRS